MARKPALGRGLKALIPDTPRARTGLLQLPIADLRPNPRQPRQRFDDEALRALADSIREHGLLQPLLVSESPDGGYSIVAGERRWRAARLAGFETVPAIVRERVDDQRDLELALVENLQRRDLTPLEEARAFEQLRADGGLSQAEIAERVGIDRSTVANALRLLKLPPEVQEIAEAGRITAGHARSLLAFPSGVDLLAWAERAADGAMSVRELEAAAASSRDRDPRPGRSTTRPDPADPNLVEAAERLSLRIGAPVEIRPRRRGGRIVITCGDAGQLEAVFDRLMGEA